MNCPDLACVILPRIKPATQARPEAQGHLVRKEVPMKHCTLVVIATFAVCSAGAADWPQFRGPGGSGVGDAKDLPVTWSSTDNLIWRTKLPAGNFKPDRDRQARLRHLLHRLRVGTRQGRHGQAHAAPRVYRPRQWEYSLDQ